MEKRVEAIIERYGSLKNETGIIAKENQGIWGYQIRIEANKSQIFERNYIVPLNGNYLIKQGPSLEHSKEVDIAHSVGEANKKAYQHITNSPKEKLEKMIRKAKLDVNIIDKNPVFSYHDISQN
jgi:hypothetical protein